MRCAILFLFFLNKNRVLERGEKKEESSREIGRAHV